MTVERRPHLRLPLLKGALVTTVQICHLVEVSPSFLSIDNHSVLSADLGLETRDTGLTRATRGPQEQSQGWQPCSECGLWLGNAWHFAQSHTCTHCFC